jgi:hypothetical protein
MDYQHKGDRGEDAHQVDRKSLSVRFGIEEDLGNAFMIEDRRRTLGADIDRDAGADDKRFGMVDLDLVAADQFNDVRPKRHSSLKAKQCRGKVLGRHDLAAVSALL